MTIGAKRQILAEVDEGKLSKTEICAKYSLPKSTLSTFIKNRHKIEQSDSQPERKRQKFVKNEDLEKALFVWFKRGERYFLKKGLCIYVQGK